MEMNVGTVDGSFVNLKLCEFVPSSVKNLHSPFPQFASRSMITLSDVGRLTHQCDLRVRVGPGGESVCVVLEMFGGIVTFKIFLSFLCFSRRI